MQDSTSTDCILNLGKVFSLREAIIELHNQGNPDKMMKFLSDLWQKEEKKNVLTKKITYDQPNDHSWDPLILWLKPSYCCFHVIAFHVKMFGLNHISSIGCGSGLLEWLLWKITDIQVTGYEVNRKWWESPHSPGRFIKHVYVDEDDEMPHINESHALFSCYFNNGLIFSEYVSRYAGPLMIIIGSNSGIRHTNPHPLEFKNSPSWNLIGTHSVEGEDLIAFYARADPKVENAA